MWPAPPAALNGALPATSKPIKLPGESAVRIWTTKPEHFSRLITPTPAGRAVA
jgi:hypothetical protein